MVARLDDVRVEPQPVAAAASRSSWISSTSKPSSFSRCSRSSTLKRSSAANVSSRVSSLPERLVARDDLVAGLVGVEVGGQPDLGVDVEQLADDVRLRDVEVVARAGRRRARRAARPSPRRRGTRTARRRRAGRARSRASSRPRRSRADAGARAARRARSAGACAGRGCRAPEKSDAVGQRVLEVARDQDRVEVVAAAGDDADRLDDRQALPLRAGAAASTRGGPGARAAP